MSGRKDTAAATPSDEASGTPSATDTAPAAEVPAGTAPAAGTVPGGGTAPAGATLAAPAQDSRTADFTAGPGGVMTDEAGVVTGDLTLRTELAGGYVTLRVQYKDADEWYVVTGGRTTLSDPADLDAVHTLVVALLNRPEG